MINQRRATDRPHRLVVMILLALLPVAFVGGQLTGTGFTQAVREANAAPVPRALPDGITKFHDASDEVTCWRASDPMRAQGNVASIACLPDAALASYLARE